MGSSLKGYENCSFGFQELLHRHRPYLWLVWSGASITPFACKIPGRLIQAGEFLPMASSNPRWQVWEDSLPSSLQSQAFPPRSQGEDRSPPEAYGNSGPLPCHPGPVALSEPCPFPAEEGPLGRGDQYPRGHGKGFLLHPNRFRHNATVFQLSPPTASGCPLVSPAVSLSLKTN